MEENVQKDYFELLRFPSVGADPLKLRDCVDCAMWLKRWLEGIGFKGELMMPPVKDGQAAPPILFAERAGAEGAPTILVYGHYDVQPADPVEEWKTPPFEPTVVDGRVYCRGAQDDKGQSFAFLCGIRDYLAAAKAAPTLKVLLEGQEESGSTALMEMAPDLRRKLAAEVMLVCDTSAAAELRPAIVAGLRGVSHLTVRLTGPNRDLHSGEYGGIAPNPAQAIAELVASLHNPDGSIAVAGFRDGIEPPSEPERRAAEAAALVAMATSAALAPESLTRRLVMPVKPRAEKAATTWAGSNVGNLASARSSSMGASVRMVATRRLRRASSTWARRFSPILPLTSSAWAMTSSRLPYCTMRAAAFLGPMPGTPGMLSEVSPLRP